MRNVLMPVDGSGRSEHSVKVARDYFSPETTRITLITVREDVDSRSSSVLTRMAKESEPLFDRLRELLDGYEVTTVVEFGLPGERIVDYAEHHDIDLIVMTTRTHTLKTAVMGSVAVYLVKHAEVPILVIPEKAVTD